MSDEGDTDAVSESKGKSHRFIPPDASLSYKALTGVLVTIVAGLLVMAGLVALAALAWLLVWVIGQI